MSVNSQEFSDSLGGDGFGLSDSVVEQEASFEEPITIRRFSSQSLTPGAFGTSPAIVYTDFPATAVLAGYDAKASYMTAGVMSAGDILLEIRDRVHESDENIGGTHPGDRVVWRGKEYRPIQAPEPVLLDGAVIFYNTPLRRSNSSSDVAGL